jgi:opacity protein-like surface antigen
VRRLPVPLLAVIVLLFSAARANAQGTSGLHFGFEGGISYPQGDAKDSFDNGWNGGALLVWNPPVIPVGLRVDGLYHRLDGSTAAAGNAEVLSATANVVVGFRAILLKPYFLAGVGAYRLDFSGASGLSAFRGKSNETGWNAGAGVSISLRNIDLIVEARYHSVSSSGGRFKFVPVSIGLVF